MMLAGKPTMPEQNKSKSILMVILCLDFLPLYMMPPFEPGPILFELSNWMAMRTKPSRSSNHTEYTVRNLEMPLLLLVKKRTGLSGRNT